MQRFTTLPGSIKKFALDYQQRSLGKEVDFFQYSQKTIELMYSRKLTAF